MTEPVTQGAAPADPAPGPRVGPSSFLTLHYRLSLADGADAPAGRTDGVATGADVIFDTFEAKPATLQMGAGQLVGPLEQCLIGLAEGESRQFVLPCEQAFGPRNPELVRSVARSVLEANSPTDTEYEPGDLVDFPAPDGQRFAGVLKSLDGEHAWFDFNHPLAGRTVRFDVRILGVLRACPVCPLSI